MPLRGIRGATSVKKNSKREIISATKEVLLEVVKKNKIKISQISAVIFSVTKDLNAEFPARGARELGWAEVPLLCTREIDVPKGLKKCIRTLFFVNTNKTQKKMKHIYLNKAKKLREDLK